MRRVTGIGGIFFKSESPEKLYQWYEKHLGITRAPDGSGAVFEWRDAQESNKTGMTVWSIFPADTKYLGSSISPFMINYVVDDLDTLTGVELHGGAGHVHHRGARQDVEELPGLMMKVVDL